MESNVSTWWHHDGTICSWSIAMGWQLGTRIWFHFWNATFIGYCLFWTLFAYLIFIFKATFPYIQFNRQYRTRRIIIIGVCLTSAIVLFALLIIFFFVNPLWECELCQYFNCIPIMAGFCDNQGLRLKSMLPIWVKLLYAYTFFYLVLIILQVSINHLLIWIVFGLYRTLLIIFSLYLLLISSYLKKCNNERDSCSHIVLDKFY
jgi:hypothetical protein